MKTNKTEVLEAGNKLSSRATPAQQENHKKVLAWIEALPEDKIPDYSHHAEGREAGALLAYKLLIKTWYDATNVPKATKN
jgi:hypothetical protein